MNKKNKKSLRASALQITLALSLVWVAAILVVSSFAQDRSGVTHSFEWTRIPEETCVAYAYIANSGSNDVSVIDTSTNTVVATVTVESGPYGVAVTPDSTHVYVTNQLSNSVSVIDTSTNTVVATVTIGVCPFGVAIKPDGTRVYVTEPGGNNVKVIDTSTNTVVATVSLPPLSVPFGVAVTPDGVYAYVADTGNMHVSVVETDTNTVLTTISVGTEPFGVAVTPDDSAYVTNQGSNTVSLFGLGFTVGGHSASGE